MKELDDFFLANLEQFESIFADIDYLGHQGTNKNKVFWLWKNGQRTEIDGITDRNGNYLYARYQDRSTTLEQKSNDRSGLRWESKIRFVGVLFRCSNLIEIGQYVSYLLSQNPRFSNIVLNTNTLEVYEKETNKDNLINNEIQLFSIDFTLEVNLQNCDFDIIRPMIELGKFTNCDTVDLGVASDQIGTYTLRQNFNGQIIDIDIEITNVGDNLTFVIPDTKLNEDYTYDAEIVSIPNGSAVDTTNIYRYSVIPKI